MFPLLKRQHVHLILQILQFSGWAASDEHSWVYGITSIFRMRTHEEFGGGSQVAQCGSQHFGSQTDNWPVTKTLVICCIFLYLILQSHMQAFCLPIMNALLFFVVKQKVWCWHEKSSVLRKTDVRVFVAHNKQNSQQMFWFPQESRPFYGKIDGLNPIPRS